MTRHQDQWSAIAMNAYETIAPSLDALAWMDIPFDDNLELATIQLTSWDVRLNGEVQAEWLRIWHNQIGMGRDSDFEDYLKICFEEKTVAMSRNLLKKALRGIPQLNLGQLVEPVLVPVEEGLGRDENFRTAANRIRKRVAGPMQALMMWTVECQMRDVGGQEQPGRWLIGVGPAADYFRKLIYVPLRRRQIASYIAKHGMPE